MNNEYDEHAIFCKLAFIETSTLNCFEDNNTASGSDEHHLMEDLLQ